MRRVRTNGIAALYDTVFNNGVITDIHVIQNNRILNDTVVSDIDLLKENRVFHRSVQNTAAGYKTVLDLCARIVLGRRKIIYLGIDLRILLEEVVPYFRL